MASKQRRNKWLKSAWRQRQLSAKENHAKASNENNHGSWPSISMKSGAARKHRIIENESVKMAS
jgi:hypothetical protein